MNHYYPQKGDWTTLAEALSVHTVAELELLAHAAGVPSIGRKAERIAALCEAVEGNRLRFSFGRLGTLGKAAVTMAAYSRDGRLSLGGFRLRFRAEPDFGKPASWWSGYEKPSLLCLFLHGDRIPNDLRARLRELVPPLENPPVRTTATLPRDAIVVERAAAAAVELDEALRLLEAQPCSSIGAVLRGGSDAVDVRVKEFAWTRILAAGGLLRSRGTKLTLTENGRDALEAPLSQTLGTLWKCWLARGEPDEAHRLGGVHGSRSKKARLTSPAERRSAIVEALADCPAGEWVPVDAFLDYIRVSGRDFQVSRARDSLRVDVDGRRVEAYALDDTERWALIEGPYVVRFLLEYASTLGIIDVAVGGALAGDRARRDPLQAFRLTELGRFFLGLSGEAPELGGTRRASLGVDEDLRIRAETPLSASERAVLGFFAQHEGDGIYRLSRARVLDSIAKRRSLDAFREFLSRGSRSPLPPAFLDFLDDCATRGRSLRPKGTARLFECRNREVAALVANHPKTRPYCHVASETLLVVPIEHDDSFRRGVREAGFGIDVRAGRGTNDGLGKT